MRGMVPPVITPLLFNSSYRDNSSSVRPLIWSLACFFLAAAYPAMGYANGIQIVEARWGFDGTVKTKEFNLLSVLLDNTTADPFDGLVTVHRGEPGFRRSDLFLDQQVYLSPRERRWVQFVVFCDAIGSDWTIAAGRSRLSIPAPPVGSRTSVYLTSDGDVGSTKGVRLKFFPAELFPASVTATNMLDVVVLDHLPRWDEARQQAFADWLAMGGKLHLLQPLDGQALVFGGPLAPLNSPLPRFAFGGGLVERHAVTRQDAASVIGDVATAKPNINQLAPVNSWFDNGLDPETYASFFTQLRRLGRPNHNWLIIATIGWLYAGLMLFVWIWARQIRRVVVYYSVLGTIVASISLMLLGVGTLGHQGAYGVYSVGVAKRASGNAWMVTEWSRVGSTRGGLYRISSPGTGAAYTLMSDAAVDGRARLGGSSELVVDLPPFSSKGFMHLSRRELGSAPVGRGYWVVERKPLQASPAEETEEEQQSDSVANSLVADIDFGVMVDSKTVDNLGSIVFRWQGGDKPPPFNRGLAVIGDMYIELQATEKGLFPKGMAQKFNNSSELTQSYNHWGEPKETKLNSNVAFTLLCYALGVRDSMELQKFTLPPDQLLLATLVETPAEWHVKTQQAVKQSAQMLLIQPFELSTPNDFAPLESISP
jgi:hypothetical protein